jgi:two-component system sensor histidine kinase CiaH
MRLSRLKTTISSPTARLAGTYLVIILVMSLGFSYVLYNTSAHELGRQLPPDSLFHGNGGGNPPPAISSFFQERISEARSALMIKLLLLNVSVLVAGIIVSYYLARRTLRPIEAAMEAQIQFVSDASHELRTPLTAIQTSNEVALRRSSLTLPEAKELIEHNTEDVKKLKALSDGLLNLAQHNKTDVLLASVKLQDVAAEAMAQVIPQAHAKDMVVQDSIASLEIIADKVTAVQALVILLDNALKYSKAGGTVYLETRSHGKFVYLDVRDDGIGIRASDLPHVFRRFYRADNARTAVDRGGYGLGLAIAKQIVDSQQARISVVSTPDKGSTFTIRWPATSKPPNIDV